MAKEKDPVVGNVFYTQEEAEEMSVLNTLHKILIKLHIQYTELGIDYSSDLIKHLKENQHQPFLEMVNKRIAQINTEGKDRFNKLNPQLNAI